MGKTAKMDMTTKIKIEIYRKGETWLQGEYLKF
jgi:hypothetical protein